MHADRYSRMVAWLKVLFPLMALALLSTLFLLSRAIDPGASIPFADKEIQERLRDQQVTGPFFSGTTADGDLISFSAEKLTTPQGQLGANQAIEVRAELDLADGALIRLQASNASFDMVGNRVDLSGDVVITTSTGYRVVSDNLTARMSELDVRSPGPVEAVSPLGKLNAGAMTLSAPKPGDPAQLIFTNGVKLIYNPKQSEE